MARYLGCGLFVCVICIGQAIGAAPPGPCEIGAHVRFLSRDEALDRLVEHSKSGPCSERTRLEREVELNRKAMQVEFAYWDLYGAWRTLACREQGLRVARETWRIVRERYERGQVSTADLMHCRGQYELFRSQRLHALADVEENERQLRSLLVLEEDGRHLVPGDAPDLTAFTPNWDVSLNEALSHRPELPLLRRDVEAARQRLTLANAFHQNRSSWPYLVRVLVYLVEWSATAPPAPPESNRLWGSPRIVWNTEAQIKLRGIMGYLAVRYLGMQMELLKDQELKTQSYLGREYEDISIAQQELTASRAQSRAFAKQVEASHRELVAGQCNPDALLKSQRQWYDALAEEISATVHYAKSRCGYAFGRGAILKERDRVAPVGRHLSRGEAQ
jgi:hypothetical protein